MRICFISLSVYGYFDEEAYADSPGGGAQRQLYLLARELSEHHDVHFVVGDYGQPRTVEIDGVTLHRSFRPTGSSIKKPLEMAKFFRAMRRSDADVFVSRNSPSTAAFSYLCARILGKQWVFNVATDRFVQRDLSYLSPPVRWSYRRALNRADGVIAQTEHQQASLRTHHDVRSTVVPNGYTTVEDTPGFDDRDLFLWVGRLDPDQKRPSLFLDLAERVPDAEFALIGVRGTERFREKLRAEMDALDNLQYEFGVPPDEIHQYYARSLALVNTSAYEGFPNTFLEAWRVGTPVLGLDVDPDRFLQQGSEGEFRAEDVDALAERVRDLHTDETFWTRVSATAKRAFERSFAINETATRYRETLERMHEGS